MTCNKLRYPLSVLLILALLIPAAPISGTNMEQAGGYIVYEQAPSPALKIDPAVSEAFVKEDYVEVLVKMTRQVNTGLVARDTLRHAPAGKQGRVAVRTALVDELRANAAAAQKSIMQYLQQEQRKGSVLEYHGYYIVNMVFVKAAPAVVEQLARRSDVKVILPNSVIRMEPPEIVESGEMTPLAVEWGIFRINAPAVWDLGFRGEGVVVGIMDTGVDWRHEALQAKWRGYNPAAPDNPNVNYNWYDATTPRSALPKDANGHGTHVTGTVLGSAGSNQIGAAPGAQWIAARIFGDDDKATSQGILNAGQFMFAPTDVNGENPRSDLAPDVINNSWGDSMPGSDDQWFRPMVQAWRDAQILPVFSAGNDGREYGAGSISNPANYPESLAVAATDSGNNLADFSSRGPGYAEGIKPEISAPGVYIRSSLPDGDYGIYSGTSMAAPHISGAAALLLSAKPDLDLNDLQQLLIDTAVPLTDPAYPESPNYGYGYGLVDTLEAVNSVQYGLITGQVLAGGIDEEAPAIEHTQDIHTILAGYGFPLEAAASDNVAVTAVKAMVRTAGAAAWTEVPMYRYNGDHLNGDYWGQVPWSLVEEPGLEYKIVAVDFAGHQAETDTFTVEVKFGLTPGWSEDFSSEPVLWDWDGDWEWGVPAAGPAPQFGGKVMATRLDGNYTSDLDSYLWAPPLDLRHANSPYLRLDHRYEIEENYDAAMVCITDDYGENWDIYYWDGDSEGWRTHYIDLNPYKGGTNQVYVVFMFAADVSVTYPGWYIDRISVVELTVTEQDIFFTDFEQNNGGFTVEVLEDEYGLFEDSWAWGSPSSGPGRAYSGNKLCATNLSGNYPYWSGSILWSPVISLGGRDNAYLEFHHWFSIESYWDYDNDMPYDGARVEFYTPEDGEFWTVQDPWYYGAKTYWSSDIYNLAFFLEQGYSRLQIGFWFHSNGYNNYPGWYIDDVRVFTSELEIQALRAGPAPAWVTMDRPKLLRSDNIEEKEKQELQQEYRPVQEVWEVKQELPFRQPLQGPEPVVQPCGEPEIRLLPVAATVTVVETGTGAATDPADGAYRLWHRATAPGKTLTLRVTAPGYQAAEVQFTLGEMETLVQDFVLAPSPVITGDLDGNGLVNVVDAVLLLRHAALLLSLTPAQLLAADADGDCCVDVADAIVILRYIADLVEELPSLS